jgi:hypothetical protein
MLVIADILLPFVTVLAFHCLLQVVGRPGGGGESDAAFTPSPPVVASDTSPCVATLTLTHQTRIRTLYNSAGDSTSPPTENGVPGQIVPPLHHGTWPLSQRKVMNKPFIKYLKCRIFMNIL